MAKIKPPPRSLANMPAAPLIVKPRRPKPPKPIATIARGIPATVTPRVAPAAPPAPKPAAVPPAAAEQPEDPIMTIINQILGRLLNPPEAAPPPSLDELVKQAQKLVAMVYAPQIAMLNYQIQQAQALGAARANQLRDIYGSFAQYQQGQPGIGTPFQQSASFQQGYLDGSRMAAQMIGKPTSRGSPACSANTTSSR